MLLYFYNYFCSITKVMQKVYNAKKSLPTFQFFFLKCVLNATIFRLLVLTASAGWLIVLSTNFAKTVLFLKNSILTKALVLVDIVVCDNPLKKKRYVIYYLFQNLNKIFFLYLTISIKENTSQISIQNIFCSAIWLEREIWDMFGIYFSTNSDLRMLLSDYATKSNPLKKNYPLTGYTEISYNISNKKMNLTPIQLAKFRAKM